MLLNNLNGIANLVRRRPQLLGVAVKNIQNRLAHSFSPNGHDGTSAPPEQVTVVVTDVCNLHCKMCPYAYSDNPGYMLNQVGRMAPALFYKLMDEVAGQPLVSFTGGEPLLHPQVHEFIAYAHKMGRRTNLVTNGWMLEKRAHQLVEAGLDWLTVSVDGPQPAHDAIRGPGSFERLARGLETILALPNRPAVAVSMALTDINYSYTEAMYGLARSWGVDTLNFNHLWMQTGPVVEAFNQQYPNLFEADEVAWEVCPENIHAPALADSLAKIERRNLGQPMLVTQAPMLNRQQIIEWYSTPEKPVKYDSTRCAWMRIKVWPDGYIKPCRAWRAGNIADEHVMDIWNGETMRNFRQILQRDGLLPICARCCYLAHR